MTQEKEKEKEKKGEGQGEGNESSLTLGSLSDSDSAKPASTSAVTWRLPGLFVSPKMHAIVLDSLGPRASGIDWELVYSAAADRYRQDGKPADVLSDLKARAKCAAGDLNERRLRESQDRDRQAQKAKDEHEARLAALTPEQREAERLQIRQIFQKSSEQIERIRLEKARAAAQKKAAA